jgi:hypothetical protein
VCRTVGRGDEAHDDGALEAGEVAGPARDGSLLLGGSVNLVASMVVTNVSVPRPTTSSVPSNVEVVSCCVKVELTESADIVPEPVTVPERSPSRR